MNTLVKHSNGNYTVITEDGTTFGCTRWFEKKTNAWHIKLPNDNPTGRIYIRESLLNGSDEYQFETKTQHRTGLMHGGWRSKMTDEEAAQVQAAEELIERIKTEASARIVKKTTNKLDTVEALEAEIARLNALRAQLQN